MLLRSTVVFTCISALLAACASSPSQLPVTPPASNLPMVSSPTVVSLPLPTETRQPTMEALPSVIPSITPASLTSTLKVPTRTATAPPKKIPSDVFNDAQLLSYGPIVYLTDWWTVKSIKADGSPTQWTYEHSQENGINPLNKFSWSPDGKSVLFSNTAHPTVYRLFMDSGVVQSVSSQDMTASFAVFSPDGKRIAFVGESRTTNSFPEIFVMNADGSDLVQLTERCGDCRDLDWSPNSDMLVYARYSDGSIYEISAQEGNPKVIVTGGFNTFPDYSPSGEYLAFVRDNALYSQPAKGGSMRLLSSKEDIVRLFTWSPDGKYIVFENFADGRRGLWILHVASGTSRPLLQGQFFSPAWSPLMVGAPESTPVDKLDDCSNSWTRLEIGAFAEVIDVIPNRVRAEPSKSSTVIGEIHRRTSFKILDGPVCADGLVFWKIWADNIPGNSGWTAEGDLKEYYLQPAK